MRELRTPWNSWIKKLEATRGGLSQFGYIRKANTNARKGWKNLTTLGRMDGFGLLSEKKVTVRVKGVTVLFCVKEESVPRRKSLYFAGQGMI